MGSNTPRRHFDVLDFLQPNELHWLTSQNRITLFESLRIHIGARHSLTTLELTVTQCGSQYMIRGTPQFFILSKVHLYTIFFL